MGKIFVIKSTSSNFRVMTEKRITNLDGIRGIAVLVVIAFHYIHNQTMYDSWLINRFGTSASALIKIAYFGWSGVDLFFILSGFLIGNILLKNKDSKALFKTFYIRRFFRIIPVYYLLVALFFLLTLTSLYDPKASFFFDPIPLPAFLLMIQNFYMAHYNHFGPLPLTPTWSLCIEEQFYLIMPFLIFLINRRFAWMLAVAGIIIAILARHTASNYYSGYVLLTSRLDSPMMGFLLAWLHQYQTFREWIARHLWWVAGLLAMMAVVCWRFYAETHPGILGHTLVAFTFVLVVILAVYSKNILLAKMLSNAFLLEMGKLSYFIYLYHQFVNGLLHLVFLKQRTPILDSYLSIGVTVISLVITYLMAMLSFKFIERPAIGYSHRFRY